MSKSRMFSTGFWSDNYIVNLSQEECHLFLYLLTNEHTSICGIYQLPLVVMSREVSMRIQKIEAILDKFREDGKIVAVDGWVQIVNAPKHQSLSPGVREGMKRELSKIPDTISSKLRNIGYGIYKNDIVSDGVRQSDIVSDGVRQSDIVLTAPTLNLTLPNLNLTELEPELNPTLRDGAGRKSHTGENKEPAAGKKYPSPVRGDFGEDWPEGYWFDKTLPWNDSPDDTEEVIAFRRATCYFSMFDSVKSKEWRFEQYRDEEWPKLRDYWIRVYKKDPNDKYYSSMLNEKSENGGAIDSVIGLLTHIVKESQ